MIILKKKLKVKDMNEKIEELAKKGLYFLPTDTEGDVFKKLNRFLTRNNLSERDEFLIQYMLCYLMALEELAKVTGRDVDYLSYLIGSKIGKEQEEMTKDDKIEFIKETINRTPMSENRNENLIENDALEENVIDRIAEKVIEKLFKRGLIDQS